MLGTRPKHLFLIGFSGSGKSTVGPILARRLKRKFIDLDALIEQKTGLVIAEIFRRRGEAAFRKLEETQLQQLLRGRKQPLVVALGGGAFQRPTIRRLAQGAGLVVYLSCNRRELYRRLKNKTDRPLLQVRPTGGQTVREARLKRIGKMLTERRANYRRADLQVSTTNISPNEAAQKIMAGLKD